ncbi:TlpA disulfide reductase family protein [Corynebacterium suicordis]|uniref:TlpA family protein disulfide reductase n=1 Tax=Corynebacterium suicordis DSM 45110 TaxID=1121369 RepID=A0ABR9ZH87_9CORY|nr:TlpA disulfide reductase family protein [Corynebacterium suicordis]MBF4552801.1 TlpA family protein disulfide reductase [Corynebacterium suicordis DSM 45110]MDR6278240.1 peroxiredoxin [Corynebacterium suicordis]
MLHVKKFAAVMAVLATMGTLAACGENSTAGTDAVAIGGSFEFVSPGGQTSISYPEDERKEIGNIQGVDLLDDSKVSLEDFEGQIVVLNAWGQWCGPCRSESDDLQAVHEKLQKDKQGTLLGINVKDPVREKAQNFVKDNRITYPSLYDPPFKSALAMGGVPASVIPTTIVLDKQHRPAHIFLQEVTEEQLWDVVEPLTHEESPATDNGGK